MLVIVNILIMLVVVAFLYRMQTKYVKFTKRVFTGLGLGILFGGTLQFIYGSESPIIAESIRWFNVIGSGYVSLLQMIVMPLIMVSITSAIINIESKGSLGKTGGTIVGTLLGTTAIAALIGIGSALLFGLTTEGLVTGARETARIAHLQSLGVQQEHITSIIVGVLPRNPFFSMTGQGSNATISVVIFSIFIGVAALGIKKKKPESFKMFNDMVTASQDVVMRLVTLVLRLTPYGVFALITKVVAGSNIQDILNLIKFVGASYVALFAMFLVHLLIISLLGLNPMTYIKKVIPVLAFAFSSRSSAGTMPLNIETQKSKLGVSTGIANLSASLGATMGQNGCAGIYPAMLAIMIAVAPGSGVVINFAFIIKLVAIVAVSSLGVAGIGGGATFAALIVLPALGFPVAIVGLLISIEPLIDMGRTALNVSGAMTTGLVTGSLLNEIDKETYNSTIDLRVDEV